MNPTIIKSASVTLDKRILSAAKLYASENRVQSWFHLWTMVSLLGCAYAILFVSTNFFLSLAVSLILSFLLLRFFVIYHDYVHKTILQHSIVAHIIFTIFGSYILAPMSIWNRSHNHHHQHNSKLNTGGIGSFPILTKKKYQSLTPLQRFSYLFVRHPLTILFGYFFTFIIGMCVRSLINNFSKHRDSLVALFFHAGVGMLLFYYGGIGLFLFGFFIPALISSCLGAYLFYAQHNYPTVNYHQKEHWSYSKAALESSSYMQMHPVMEWFTANIGYHHIHHLNAAIPFYKLKKAYNAIPELKKKKDTTLHLLDIWECLKLKVWDPSTGKMIGVSGLH